MAMPNEGIELSEDESRGAVFMVQPEEVPQYKALRRIVDKVFLARDQFLLSSVNYLNMSYGDEGVNRHLRSMLFRPAKRLRRGVRRSEVLGTATGGDTDGHGNSLSAVKQTQRQSKQKERCENRLMSLLFATIYDPATKQCRLVQGAPPLKLRRQDKNGLFRNVSNYTDVRMYLRNSMASILSGHTEGVKSVIQMLPAIYKLLPLMFILIGRTFFLMLNCEKTLTCQSKSDENEDNSPTRSEQEALKVLDNCMNAIQDYITTWERRNFTTDNRLTSSLEAGVANECYISIRDLLASMITVIAPHGDEPYKEENRKLSLYGFGLHHGFRCSFNDADECSLGKMCPKGPYERFNKSLGDACLKYMAALDTCASMAASVDISSIDESLNFSDFPLVLWDNSCATTTLHRLNNRSVTVQDRMERNLDISDDLFNMFVQQTRTDIARCWGAFGRSNSHAMSILATLEIKNAGEMRATVTELIFGGGIAATALFEREKEVIPICAKLRSKKGPQLVMMNEDDSDDDKEVADLDRHENLDVEELLSARKDIQTLDGMEQICGDVTRGNGGKSNPAGEVRQRENQHAKQTETEIVKDGAQVDHNSKAVEVEGADDIIANGAECSQSESEPSLDHAERSRAAKEVRVGEKVSSRISNNTEDLSKRAGNGETDTSSKKPREVAQKSRKLLKRGSVTPPSSAALSRAVGSPNQNKPRQVTRRKRRRAVIIQKSDGERETLSTPPKKARKRK